jgi:PadR family transcriptional regulator, regulatory protein AphA
MRRVMRDFIIRTERDFLELISFCAEHAILNVLIYEANFSPEIFDLKTTLAGTLLQKFDNYHLRGAALISLEKIKSERFKELIFECNQGNLFRFYEYKAAAEE